MAVLPVPIDPTGRRGPTPGQARGPGWRRSSHGLYVPAAVDPAHPDQRIVEQAARLPPEAAVTGWAAMRLLGCRVLDGLAADGRTRIPVPLAVGPRARLRPQVDARLLRDRLDSCEIRRVRTIRCTRPERAVFDAVRDASDAVEAVVLLDAAMAADLTSAARVRDYLDARSGWRGVGQVRAALPRSSERCWSPNETRLRMIWAAELPPPLVNAPVFDLSGRLLGMPDLLDVASGLVGEFDGAHHRRARQHSDDIGREDRFRRVGLEVVRVTGPDLLVPGRVSARIRAAHERALRLPPAARGWTIDPPAGWDPGPSLDERLAVRDLVRSETVA